MEPHINPYESPAPLFESKLTSSRNILSTQYLGFHPAVNLTWTVCGLLAFQIAVALLIALTYGVWYWDLGQHLLEGMDADRVANHTAVQQPLEWSAYGLHFASLILFLFWLYRVHRNVADLDNDLLEFSPGWAVGWFFIPLANLYKPYLVLRETWQASDPKTLGVTRSQWAAVSPATIVGWWWGCRLAVGFGGVVLTAMIGNPETVEEYQRAAILGIGAIFALEIPYNLFVFRLVWRIHQMQQDRYARLCMALPTPDGDERALTGG